MRASRQAGRWLAVGLAVLGLAWLFVLPKSVALYDGLGYPDEPYRYVHPPAGYRSTPTPTAASGSVSSPGQGLQVASRELGPQIVVNLEGGSFASGSFSGGPVTLTATPVSASVPPPPEGAFAGNVYAVTASADLLPSASATIDLRAPSAGQPGPVFETLVAGRWTTVATERVGNDVYRARLTSLGDWALVQVATVTRNGQYDFGTPDSFNGIEAVLAIAGPVAIVVIVVVFVRNGRRRSAQVRAAAGQPKQ